MKKLSLNPLQLDKQIIAILNKEQLQQLMGGTPPTLPCELNPRCNPNGGSTGCGAGSSTCFAR